LYQIYIGNPFDILNDGDVICVTTNGVTKKDGKAVMGAGIAKFFRDTFKVDSILGEYLKLYGNRSFKLGRHEYKGKNIELATFPTKHSWRDNSDINLISKSSIQIKEMADKNEWKRIYIPIPGCSNGGLKWSNVKNSLENLDERFVVFSINKDDFDK
jgi:hypothetical protein